MDPPANDPNDSFHQERRDLESYLSLKLEQHRDARVKLHTIQGASNIGPSLDSHLRAKEVLLMQGSRDPLA